MINKLKSEIEKELERGIDWILARMEPLIKEWAEQTRKEILEDIEEAQEDCGNLDWISKDQAIKIINKRMGGKE